MIHQNGGKKMKKYGSFSGTVTMIQDYLIGSDEELKGCFKLMSLLGEVFFFLFFFFFFFFFLPTYRTTSRERIVF
jgi:hypothetical protein